MKQLSFFIICVLLSTATYAQKEKDDNFINLGKEILRLENEVKGDTAMYKGWNNVVRLPGLLANKYSNDVKYNYIFTHPDIFKDSLLTRITSPEYSWQHKYYMLGLLQGMCIDNYIPVLQTIYNIVNAEIKKNISDTGRMQAKTVYPYIDVLLLAIDQEYLSREVQNNLNNPALKKVLESIKADALLPKQIVLRANWLLNGAQKKPLDAKLKAKFSEQKKEANILFECKK